MSFSSDIKSNMAASPVKERHCAAAELAAAVIFGAQSEESAIYATEDFLYAKRLAALCRRACGMDIEGAFAEGRSAYAVLFDSSALRLVGITLNDGVFDLDKEICERDCCAASFVRGAFFAAGSVSAPEKMYRLDITARSEKWAQLLAECAERFGIAFKIARRVGNVAAYVKTAQSVSDTLAMMGARRAVMDLVMAKAIKERRNFTNRLVNCDTANAKKTVTASVRVRAAIEKIGAENLPENLREVALLRVRYPEASIEQLGQMLTVPLSKSGVSHRLARITDIAENEV
ncbi:MAG: DNA-binding protein WhiA [Clostridia bacterium]|nr:DNA-binding protein WhiA [Clostridia bacterium]